MAKPDFVPMTDTWLDRLITRRTFLLATAAQAGAVVYGLRPVAKGATYGTGRYGTGVYGKA
jgi:hypothetical protein